MYKLRCWTALLGGHVNVYHVQCWLLLRKWDSCARGVQRWKVVVKRCVCVCGLREGHIFASGVNISDCMFQLQRGAVRIGWIAVQQLQRRVLLSTARVIECQAGGLHSGAVVAGRSDSVYRLPRRHVVGSCSDQLY